MPKNEETTTLSISSGTIVRAILILILFYFLFFIRDVVLVILAAIVIASAVEPGTNWFVKRKIPRIFGVLFIYIGTVLILVSAFYYLFIPLLGESTDFLRTLPSYSSAITEEATGVVSSGPAGFLQGFSESFSLQNVIESFNTILSNLSSGFIGILDAVFGGILSFMLITVLSFYLAVQEDGVGKFLRIVTPINKEEYVIDLWERSKRKIGLWMQGQLLLAVLVGVLSFLGLTIIGVPNALLLSSLAALFELIPIFGAFLAAGPAILIAFLDGGVSLALITAGLYIIIQQFESQLIYPLVVKKVVGVPPIISIVALVIGAKVAGFLGIILSVPVAAVLMEFFNDIKRRKILESKK